MTLRENFENRIHFFFPTICDTISVILKKRISRRKREKKNYQKKEFTFTLNISVIE